MKKCIEAIATFCSIISLAFASVIPLIFRIIIVAIGITSFGFLFYDYYRESQTNEIVCHSNDEIIEAMKRIIKMQGKICIMSRDLTWVNTEVEACICAKAQSVLIFAEKESDLTNRLISAGVTVKYYGFLNFEPKTRFTMIRYNKSNPQVAIANTQNSVRKNGNVKHTIYQTENGRRTDDWINSLAGDMIHLCNLICSGEHNEQKS